MIVNDISTSEIVLKLSDFCMCRIQLVALREWRLKDTILFMCQLRVHVEYQNIPSNMFKYEEAFSWAS